MSSDSKILCFDLDDTLCFPNHSASDSHTKYGLATPNYPIINRLTRWFLDGHRIIIHTARRMLTHDGDLDKIQEDVGWITQDWLEWHQVPYDELIFGKPYADKYIDDKAINPSEL